ncbi:DEAD/DEAH box helicase, partial [bacterium]|nr:DEAD/DEAH box helicase [bacterium]
MGLSDSLKAWVVAALGASRSEPVLVVLSSGAAARNFIDGYRFFAGAQKADRIHYLPALDFDYYRSVLPNPSTLCERNVGLFHAINDSKGRVFVTTAQALLQKVFPASEFLRAARTLVPEEEIDRDGLIQSLIEMGYRRQPTATDPGIFAVRGGVVDIFCPLYPNPARLEFYGDFIEEIRFFEAESQRSLNKMDRLSVIPVGQSLVPRGEDFQVAFGKVKERLDGLGLAKPDREALLEKIEQGNLPSEAAFLFPLLSGGSRSLMDYFDSGVVLLTDSRELLLEVAEQNEVPRLQNNHALFEAQPLPIAAAEDLFLGLDDFRTLTTKADYRFEPFETPEAGATLMAFPPGLEAAREKAIHASSGALDGFAAAFRDWMDKGYQTHIVFHTRTHAEKFQMLFEPYALPSALVEEGAPAFQRLSQGDFRRLSLWQGYLAESWVFPELKMVLLSEEAIFGQKKRTSQKKSKAGPSTDRLLAQFREMAVGDYVVHKEFGIGRYLGLKSMPFLGVENDYVLMEYKDGDKLYIPVYRLNVLQKYVGGESGAPVLDKLGTDRWTKAKGKARRAIAELAAELMKLQAKRKLIPAFAFSPPGAEYRQFEMEFPFDETPDQFKAIEDVMGDMGRSFPMDRLICGDVGYGKTEVAMRAAYRSVLDKKQVAVLVPTTVLAFQHFESFKKRFANAGVSIELISRMRKPAEVKDVLARAKEGKVDIVVGTHRLLSSDVIFKDLGLIVIDEEHRFGVTDKEKLKKMRESVHVLAMTATPIPRTLNMAMSGIKEISVITTPPPDRLSVRTFVCRSSPEVISEAIRNELGRGGQVFFVHNRVESLGRITKEIQDHLPKVSLEAAHGQMDGEVLEQKMLTFYKGDAQILVCTTIIE